MKSTNSLTLTLKPRSDKAKIVAEIGCNHKGDMEIAKEMIKMAAVFCGADYVKFQKRSPRELLSEEQYNSPHPNPANSYGKTYGEHRENLEFGISQHNELVEECKKWGIGYSCSVWDLTSAKEIASLEPDFIKVPSATNTNCDVLNFLCDNYAGDIHLSLGMTTDKEKSWIYELFNRKDRLSSLILYHTTSGYPVDFDDLCLLEISKLIADFKDDVKGYGFSGHHLGIFSDVIAYTLGAQWIERHFTLDRTWKGTDHAASLEPDGLRRVVRDVKNAQKTLSFKSSQILPVEESNREKLKWKQ